MIFFFTLSTLTLVIDRYFALRRRRHRRGTFIHTWNINKIICNNIFPLNDVISKMNAIRSLQKKIIIGSTWGYFSFNRIIIIILFFALCCAGRTFSAYICTQSRLLFIFLQKKKIYIENDLASYLLLRFVSDTYFGRAHQKPSKRKNLFIIIVEGIPRIGGREHGIFYLCVCVFNKNWKYWMREFTVISNRGFIVTVFDYAMMTTTKKNKRVLCVCMCVYKDWWFTIFFY